MNNNKIDFEKHSHWLGKPIADRRGKILYAAQEVFASEGFRTAEVKTIAERAGVGKATIYKHFKSKEDVLLQIVEENLHFLRDTTIQNLIGPGDVLSKLRASANAIASFMEKNREFSKVLIQEAGEFMGDIQRQHLALIEQSLPIAEVLFAELRKDGYFTALDTQTTVKMIINFMTGTIYTWALTGEGNLTEMAQQNLNVLIEGLKSKH